jgi:uncharacterized protein
MAKVIITGGTGLVGKALVSLLAKDGYETAILTRHPAKSNEYQWDIEKSYIDPHVLEGAGHIIHLAGASVADMPWTAVRKKEIINSRVRSAARLHDLLKNNPNQVRTFISASAVGYYGDGGDKWQTEDTPAGSDFLADVCRKWEAAADSFSDLGLRICKLRIGIVLSHAGGALPKMDLPLKFGIGAYFGDGRQFLPWIHIHDLCRIFVQALENENMSGPYNACAPYPVSNKEMSRQIAIALNRPFLPLPAPAFAIKAILGEGAQILLNSNRCTSDKIRQTGFRFLYPDIGSTLHDIYKN